MENLTEEDRSNQAAGYKATMSNPSEYSQKKKNPLYQLLDHLLLSFQNADHVYRVLSDVSKEAQEEAKKQFEALGGEKAFYGKQMDANEDKNPNQVAGGLKA